MIARPCANAKSRQSSNLRYLATHSQSVLSLCYCNSWFNRDVAVEIALKSKPRMFSLSLAALGVVYGDIGTSPLYALRESLGGLPINLTDVLGVLSLIFWALILVISIKYLWIIFRADNEGEGGILALLALLKRSESRHIKFLFVLSIFGAGLLLGDGMLTPAISVVSAIEGLKVISPSLAFWVLPITILILVLLFSAQSFGTGMIGKAFGPLIFLWFFVIAVLGTIQIVHNPVVLKAIDPRYAIEFFLTNGWHGYVLLGGVFLVMTGGEALYVDIGHFGKNPIRISWFTVALPALLLSYFGQSAYLLNNPLAISNPFFMLAPSWFFIPLLAIATMATIIASQAVISATFSMTKQAVLLGLYPHLPIVQTSAEQRGQIYIPQINFILAIGALFLIVEFKTADALTHAYGIAVNLDMLLVTMLVGFAAYKLWKWPLRWIIGLFSVFLAIDLLFLGANLQKIMSGGWMPISFALFCAFVMYTWHKGMNHLRQTFYTKKEDFSKVLLQLHEKNISVLPDATAVFITDIYDQSGGSFLNFLKLSHALPENALILSYQVKNIPYVNLEERFEVKCLDKNICVLKLNYGFMDFISIPYELSVASIQQILPFELNLNSSLYLVEIPTIVASKLRKTMWFFWQEKLFAFLMRNYSANINIEFYQLPFDRTIAIGTYCII